MALKGLKFSALYNKRMLQLGVSFLATVLMSNGVKPCSIVFSESPSDHQQKSQAMQWTNLHNTARTE